MTAALAVRIEAARTAAAAAAAAIDHTLFGGTEAEMNAWIAQRHARDAATDALNALLREARDHPEVGIGASIRYPQDSYPAVVVKVTAHTATLARLVDVSKATGHQPAYMEGPFPVWSHTYTVAEMTDLRDPHSGIQVARRSKKSPTGWTLGGTPLSMGAAVSHRNYSDD